MLLQNFRRRLGLGLAVLCLTLATSSPSFAVLVGTNQTYAYLTMTPSSVAPMELRLGGSLPVQFDVHANPSYAPSTAAFRVAFDPTVLQIDSYSVLPTIASSPQLLITQGPGYLSFDYSAQLPHSPALDLSNKLRLLDLVFVGKQLGTSSVRMSNFRLQADSHYLNGGLVAVTVVPEPSSFALAAAALLGLFAYRRKLCA